MKKKSLALALLGVSLFSTTLLYEQVAKASDPLEAVTPFNVSSQDWNGYRVGTNTVDKSLAFRRPAGSNPNMPIGTGAQVFKNANWDGMSNEDIKHISFLLKAGQDNYKNENSYVRFASSMTGRTYENYWVPFSNVETIEGLENILLSSSISYSGFFSDLTQVKVLDTSNILIDDPDHSYVVYNFSSFLKGMTGLEVLILSGDSSTDKPLPNYDVSNETYTRFRWPTATTTTTDFLNLNPEQGKSSRLREISYNSSRTPLSGAKGGTNLSVQKGNWVRLTKPQHLGGVPYKNAKGKYELLDWDTLYFDHRTNNTQETWALNTWGITEDDASGFKPIDPYAPEEPEAPETPKPDPGESNATSSIKISLNTGNIPVGEDPIVINPTDPGSNPEVIDGDKSPGNQGTGMQDFYINWVSDLDFGNVPITGDTISATANKITMTPKETAPYIVSPFIQVTDRSGKRDGWKLTVKGSPLQNEDGDQVPEASVVLGEGIVSQSNSKDQPSIKPTFTASNKNVLSGQEVEVLNAGNTVQTGVWSVLLEKDGNPTSKFTIPKGTALKQGNYTSTLTWILKQEPGSE